MAKLYELISEPKGVKFPITVGEVTKELTLGRFTLVKMVEYEKRGLTVEQLMEKMQEFPAMYGTQVGWDLLVEKDEFNNDIEIFRKCLGGIESLNSLGEALIKAIEESRPVEKKETG